MEYTLIQSPYPSEGYSTIEKILLNRGIKPQELKHYLNTSVKDVLPPSLIARIKDGIAMLLKHIAAGHHILIVIDCDVDGYTSAAGFANCLHKIFPTYTETHVHFVHHNSKSHGLKDIEVDDNIKLVVAPDSSSNDYEQHKKLYDKGVDVLIIDHHEAPKVSEYACVINNQLCDYPTKSLSGVGMVYKFFCYLDEMMNTHVADSMLDLVSLGMIADMMDQRDFETQYLILEGLKKIENPLLSAMIEQNAYSIGDTVTPIGVAFYVAPYINAVTRVGTMQEKTLVFEAMLDYKGNELVPSTKRGHKSDEVETVAFQASRTCNNVKSRQKKLVDKGLEWINQAIDDYHLLDNKILIIPCDPEAQINKNLTGLIANKLMAKHQRPVLVLNQVVEDDTVYWNGSGRGYDKSKLTDFREFLNQTGLVNYAEGHANAFGVSIKEDNLNDLIQLTNKVLDGFDFSPSYAVDFIFNSSNFNAEDILDIATFKNICGKGVAEPYVALEHIKVTPENLKLMSPDKKPTLKITLPNGTSLIKFQSSQEEYNSLLSGAVTIINAVGHCEKNEWNGRVSPQILIEDYDIVQVNKYYF